MGKIIQYGVELSGSSSSADRIKYDETKNVKEAIDEKIAAINTNLTASDGTPFRFGINADGEYGYIVTDSEGADIFFPFSSSSTQKLYEALRYSGLVTEDMTFDEMCAALTSEYPQYFDVLQLLPTSSYWNCTSSACDSTGIAGDGTYLQFTCKRNAGNGSGSVRYQLTMDIDLSKYKTIEIQATNNGGEFRCGYSGEASNEFIGGTTATSINQTVDISSVTGKVKFYLYLTCYAGSSDDFRYCKITKFRLLSNNA